MHITDEERRGVARRLREIRPCESGHIEWWEIARALGIKQPAGWFGWEKFEPDSANRLADLIEPDISGIDCDALLALAKEMVEMFRLGAFTGEGLDVKWCRELHGKYTCRICEVLGVES